MKIGLFLILFGTALNAGAEATPFRLHLSSEPRSIDPHIQKSSASSYLLQSLHRNLLRYENEKDLQPDLAESCRRDGKALVCVLKKNLKWSDGQAIVAADFVAGIRRLLDPQLKAHRPDLAFPLKNARAIYEGRMKPETLGVATPDPRTLRFEFESADPEFEYNLTSFVMAPYRPAASPTSTPTTGPYRVQSWDKGQRIRLTANPHYPGGAKDRPDVELFFISEDSTALRLYEKGSLDFLRRMPSTAIPKYRGKSEFHWVPVLRLDYLGFGPRLRDKPGWREALSLALDYDEITKLLNSDGRLGCPGVPPSWFKDEKVPCHPFDPARARKALGPEKPGPLQFLYSQLAGDDIKRAAEWEQAQWKKHLNVQVRLRGMENKLFLAELRDRPTDIFRKGIAADRPTCHAMLERFLPDHPENHLDLKAPALEALIHQSASAPEAKDRRAACESALRWMMENFVFIPLGRQHFAVLAKPSFTGWRLNEMNQLDLADLRRH